MNEISPCTNVNNLLVTPLDRFSRTDLELVGGKASNLGDLIRAGFPIPAGFVGTTKAYNCFVTANHLGPIIDLALDGEQDTGTTIRAAFEAARIPLEVEQQILSAYDGIGAGPVAVRSSATAEDLPEAAFAGQQDTFLNVIGPQAVLDAVRRCWASLWSERAIAYRAHQRFGQGELQLAVLVQKMVAAEVAGVMFTANPISGAREEIVIDASPGLGEAVVSGLVTPDHWVLRKRRLDWKIVERRLGRREVIVLARPEGGTEQVTGSETAGTQAFPDAVLGRLAKLGEAIQQHFGRPQDIEWVWDGREIFIVQSRPITALLEPLHHLSRPVQMLAGIFAEMFPVRPYPLDQTTWVPAISDAAVVPIFSLIGVKVPPLEQQFQTEDGVVIRFEGNISFRPTPGILLAPVRMLAYALRYNPVHWRADPVLAEAKSRVRDLEVRDVEDLPWEDLLITIREALALVLPLAGEVRRRYYPRALFAAGLLWAVLKLTGQGDLFGRLLNNGESTTMEANRALENLAARIRSDPVLAQIFASYEASELWVALEAQPAGREFLDELRAFLDRYGHREVVLSTVLQPTWKDAPELVLNMLKGFTLADRRDDEGRKAREEAQEKLLAQPSMKFWPLRPATLKILTTARCLWQIREDTHFNATLVLPVLRRTILEMGCRLTEVHVLDAPADVFHLKLGDLELVNGIWPPSPELANRLRTTVLQRKKRRASLEGMPLVDPRFYQQVEPGGEALLRGTPGSPGIAEGPVCVIRSASEFGRLRPGDVLVAPYTNPAWTPLFGRAAAVVVDGGAAGSHAAIVAREYNLPAVMGTVTGTQKLVDGERVRVDGYRGVVLRAHTHAVKYHGKNQGKE